MIETTDAEQIERLNSRVVELLREREDLTKANQLQHALVSNRDAEIERLQAQLDLSVKAREIERSGYQADLAIQSNQLVKARTSAIEECAVWHAERADLETNSLHCGDNSSTIAATHRVAAFHRFSARELRALASQPDDQGTSK